MEKTWFFKETDENEKKVHLMIVTLEVKCSLRLTRSLL